MAKVDKTEVKDAAPVGRYKVLSTLRHDGDNYVMGDTVELTEKQAAPLLKVNAVQLIKVTKADSKAGGDDKEEDDDPNKKPEGGE